MSSTTKYILMIPNQLLRNQLRNKRRTGTVLNKKLIRNTKENLRKLEKML